MVFLIDHNIEGYALILFGTLGSNGWLDFVPIHFIMFPEVNLPINSDDRLVEIVLDIDECKGVGRLFIP